ncbi:hypothetical protein JQ621_29705 [Bradyrhizobium manausense]|uniref:hypothetical protein n=1 Tax=Bradyrhizobium manausense TaxID=989370 RepID=UPI001BA9DB1B|nr:hypothetical protein [Bradyrhizobium manausense]MBR1091652.1 hypothetical protein [Bradyrhizobium manausense]
MLRIQALLAITLSLASIGIAAPASAHASTTIRPLETEAGRLPRPPLVPKVLPTYCETHNCLMPPRPQPDR